MHKFTPWLVLWFNVMFSGGVNHFYDVQRHLISSLKCWHGDIPVSCCNFTILCVVVVVAGGGGGPAAAVLSPDRFLAFCLKQVCKVAGKSQRTRSDIVFVYAPAGRFPDVKLLLECVSHRVCGDAHLCCTWALPDMPVSVSDGRRLYVFRFLQPVL